MINLSPRVFFLVIVLLPKLCFSQTLSFKNYTVENGLPQSTVYTSFEDSRGYLWAGTQGGVCSFDGKEFRVFDSQKGLIDNHVTAISEDDKGIMWFGHRSGALSYLKGENVYTFRHASWGQNNRVNAILISGNALFVATEGSGLFKIVFNKKDTIVQRSTQQQGLLSDFINDIHIENESEYWLATDSGIFVFNPESLRMVNSKLANYFPDESCNSIYKSAGHYWFGTNRGAHKITSTGDEYTINRFSSGNGLCNDIVNDILEDKEGNTWFATMGGVSRLNKNFECYNIESGILSNKVYALLQDRERCIWFSQDDGLSKYTDDRFVLYDKEFGLVHEEIYSIMEEKPGVFWLGTAQGISVINWNGPNGKTKIKNLTEKEGLPGNHVYNIFKDSRGKIWISSIGKGAAVFNPDNNSFRYFNRKNGLPGTKVVSINEDQNGKIWIATLDSGLACFDYSINNIKYYNTKNGLPTNSIWTIFKDSKKDLWFGSNDKGLIKLNADNYSFIEVEKSGRLINKSFGSISEDSKGNLWIASIGGGIFKFDGKDFTHYGTELGLKSNNPYFVFCDKKDIIWIGTNTGIDRLDPATNKITNYGKEDGFLGIETNQNAIYGDSKGTLWIGTVRGLIKFNSSKIKKSNNLPLIEIRKIRIFFKDTLLSSGAHLAYEQNHITFDFAAISLSNFYKMQYKYILKGFDKDWSPLIKENYVTYTNLSPGKYEFIVKALNTDGAWSTPETYSFIIEPPYWRTWWFLVSSILFAVLLAFAAFRFRVNLIKKKERKKASLEIQFAELRMEALRAQMNPHFIFNCLNSIQYFIAINDKTSAISYLSKFSQLIRSILDNSMHSMVLLTDELDMLSNYIEMERLRLDNEFEYNIEIDSSLSIHRIEIPPLLIQPYVENAIIHGLRHKKGKGVLSISLSKVDSHILCKVEDNGIGRNRSAELNKKKNNHKSTGLKVTQKRFEILHEMAKTYQKSEVKIVDLEVTDPKISGTRVEILIPLQYN